MRTKLLLLLLLANFSIYAQYTLIPDINFEHKLISLGIDSGPTDGKVLTANLASVTELQMQFRSISDLTGIQDFTNLTSLDCSNNLLTSLDISKNTALTTLNCDDNKLADLNLSKNIHLKTLDCNDNLLTFLDVSKNLELTWLYCFGNKLTSLDVTKNILLDDLYFSDNKITTIDLSRNPLLISLYAENNLLTSLDLSKNPKLVILYIRKNQISDIDISKNPEISLFNCSYNALNSANLKNGKNNILNSGLNLTNNPNLTCIQVDNATYSNTNWSTKKDVTATYNEICASPFTLIPDVNFENKLISKGLDSGIPDGKVLSANISSVTDLEIYNSSIKDLSGIEGFTALEVLNCGENQITNLDFSKNLKLKQLECYKNKLTSLNLTKNTALSYLDCFTNQLTTLDLSQNKLLTIVYCYDNLLTSLNVTGLAVLEDIDCPDNQLTSLDVSTNTGLKDLHCYRNKLTSLDLSKNLVLNSLVCYSNELTYLNLKNGNNTNFIVTQYTKFTNNPNLTCIEVDDVTYSNTNWAALKDATASYSTNCPTSFVAIPDQNFEQKLIDLGIDTDGLNGRISIAGLSSVTSLDLSNSGIKDISGIKSFTSLTFLNISNNQITFLDLSGNTNLETLNASSNLFTMLDLSKNTQITIVYVINNPLVSLNLRNGNNRNFILLTETGKKSATSLYTTFLGLTTLSCIQVDDADYSNTNWSNIKETTTTYSNTCKSLGIEDSVFAETTIYPNPTNGEVNINNITLEKATIYNTLGQLVKSFTLNSSNTNNTINLSGLPKGVYYIYLINQNAASAKKVIVE